MGVGVQGRPDPGGGGTNEEGGPLSSTMDSQASTSSEQRIKWHVTYFMASDMIFLLGVVS